MDWFLYDKDLRHERVKLETKLLLGSFLLILFVLVDKVFCKSIKEAVQNGDIHELQRLVRQGKKINENDSKFSFSPLHWAAHYGSLEVSAQGRSSNRLCF